MSNKDESLGERLYELTREMRLMSSFDSLFSLAVAERAGMHNTDIETLDLLNVLGPMTAGQLSQMTGLSSGATTRLIDRLAGAGLVRRIADRDDRRRVHIEPVPDNLEEIGQLYAPLAEALGKAWASYSQEELAVILRFVRESNAIVATQNARLRGQDYVRVLHFVREDAEPRGQDDVSDDQVAPANRGHEMPPN